MVTVGQEFSQIFMVLVSTCAIVSAIVLDSDVEEYANKIVKEFDQDPRNRRFDNVIEPPVCPVESSDQQRSQSRKKDFFLPRLFIWCPVTHYGTVLRCPEHGGILEIGEWTNVLTKSSCYRNPRLVYAIGGNIILIQRVYVCRQSGMRHFYLSASKILMASVSQLLRSSFPFKIYHRSACTKKLLEFTQSLIVGGVNFLKISETIASMNYKSYCHRGTIYLASLSDEEAGSFSKPTSFFDDFYSDILFSFPSANFLIYMYLEQFQEMRPIYEHEMSRLCAKTISCDHTFKVSKNIVALRAADSKFVGQFQNLFIVLNDKKEVIEWRFTKTHAFEEIKDLLENLQRRPGVQLKCIYLDDCCKMRRLYQEIFVDVPVKLDIFHAVQRVTNTIPKGTEFSKQISKEFGLIFRADGDLDQRRCHPTPEISVIQQNLRMFLDRWQHLLETSELEKTCNEIDKIFTHISQGCLSGIEDGDGTEGNEALHRLLNRSLLCGSSILGPELALAILTALFYAYNCKIRGEKHTRNAKVTPVLPVEGLASLYQCLNTPMKPLVASHLKMQDHPVPLDGLWTAQIGGISGENNNDVETTSSMEDQLVIADEVQHLFNESIAKNVIDDASKLHKILNNLNKRINDRSVDAFDFLFKGISEYDKLVSLEEPAQVQAETHRQNLQRNLSSMGLEVDPVSGDGDCAFSSIIRQLYKLPEFWTDEILRSHLQGMGLSIDEKNDAFTLRQRFVDHVQANEHYQLLTGICADKLNEETELFREKGTFCGNLGDLVIKVCSDILRIPILVITSLAQHRFVPFIPDDRVISSTIYIAYNSHGSGHYDGVHVAELGQTESDNSTFCSCGKNKKRGSQASCQQRSDKRGGCPCVKKNVSCTRKCKCKNCNNLSKFTALSPPSKLLRCRCGESAANKTDAAGVRAVSCRDNEKKSKCPCLGSGQGCSELCRCFNCGNVHGIKLATQFKSPSGDRKKKRIEAVYRRPKSCDFLAAGGFAPSSGPWTNLECAVLAAVIKILSFTSIAPTADNISKLFNYVVTSSHCQTMPYKPSSKSVHQISGKLSHLERKKAVSNAR